MAEVAKALGVRYVLEGSVRKAGNRVRVTAQLINSTSGGHVWASRFDRELTDIFAIQDELTKEIVSALKMKLTLGEQDRLNQKRDVKVEAFELFLRGREQAWTATRTGGIAARGLLERAIAIEPNYAGGPCGHRGHPYSRLRQRLFQRSRTIVADRLRARAAGGADG